VDNIYRQKKLSTTFIDKFYTKYSAVEKSYPQFVVIVDKLRETIALVDSIWYDNCVFTLKNGLYNISSSTGCGQYCGQLFLDVCKLVHICL
jgi:hypothetical protein